MKTLLALLVLLLSCSAAAPDSVIIMGRDRSLASDLAQAQRSVAGLASLSITTIDLATAGIRTSIVNAHVKEETKAARINNIGTDPTNAQVLSAFVALADDEALQFSTTTVLSCATFHDCVANATLLCEDFLDGSIADTTRPTDNVCPLICEKNGVLGAALVTCP